MRILYLDCASGISGDMMLGALVDAGANLAVIQAGIDSLGLEGCRLELSEVKRHSFRAAKIRVDHPPEHAHRHLHHITDMIAQSRLSDRQQELACRIFTRLAEAEAKVHGTTVQKVHFHEVGAVDSIADIVGSSIGLDLLAPDRIVCSPVPTGYGYIQIAHGRCSLPAPATAELLQHVPLASCNVEAELTTPTGAAILKAIVDQFGPLPPMAIERIGYGAGDKDFDQQANLLRLIVGTDERQSVTTDQVAILETNVDDVTAEVVGYCCQRLFTAGALDVYTSPIYMKKNRPATKLTVICHLEDATQLESVLFDETQTLGIRRWTADRAKLKRAPGQRATPWGMIKGKCVEMPDGNERFFPEYEDCRRVAEAHKIPLQQVMDVAKRASID
jgi:uncharacterized protein (TIGR00299 family) protein